MSLRASDERDLMEAADLLAEAERDHDIEFLRLVAAGDSSYVATVKARATHGPLVTRMRANYEIVLARLRR